MRTGKAKLKNIQQEGEQYSVTMFPLHHGNYLITDGKTSLETANEKAKWTVFLPKMRYVTKLDIRNISYSRRRGPAKFQSLLSGSRDITTIATIHGGCEMGLTLC